MIRSVKKIDDSVFIPINWVAALIVVGIIPGMVFFLMIMGKADSAIAKNVEQEARLDRQAEMLKRIDGKLDDISTRSAKTEAGVEILLQRVK